MGRTRQRTQRVTTEAIEAWLEPVWREACEHFNVEDRAAYSWYRSESTYGRCHLWDPGRVMLSRDHFRRFFLEDDTHFAAQVVVHELLHGLGINHDGRIGWSMANNYPLDEELVDHLFEGKPPTKNVRLMLKRVDRAWERRDKLFCPGTMRPHAVRMGGAFCALCELLVEDVELVLRGPG